MNSNDQKLVKKAVALHLSGDTQVASQLYAQILTKHPDNLVVLVNHGVILLESGQIAEALKLFKQALHISPKDIEAINNYGNCLQELGQTHDAIKQFEKAHNLAPKNSAVSANLGRSLLRKGDYKSAIEILETALTHDPNNVSLKFINALALPVIPENSKQLHESRKRQISLVDQLANDKLKLINPVYQIGMTNFLAGYHGYNEYRTQKKLASCFKKACPDLNFTAPHINKPRKKKRISIGFVSLHLNSHTISKLYERMILGFDDSQFEIYLFYPETNSIKRKQVLCRFEKYSENVFFPKPQLQCLRSVISKVELDILYFLDIGMEPITYFLSFSRLAPIQCAGLGHPITTGVPTIDYFISSKLIEPRLSKNHYTEKLIELTHFPTDYTPPEKHKKRKSRNYFKFRSNSNIYFCPQSLFKIHPSFDYIIAEILRTDSHGKVIFIEGQQEEWGHKVSNRLIERIPDVAERVQFLPRLSGSDFLDCLSCSDVILDTTHFCGGNTSYEAFACGKIVITLPGEFMRSRVTLGLYTQMGIMELVAKNSTDYVELAIRFGTDKKARFAMEERIRQTSSAIFNTRNALNSHEQLFRNWSKSGEKT